MAVPAGHHRLAPEAGRIVLRTSRAGLAATAGHDLTIDAPRWSGNLVVQDDGTQVSLEALTDRDRREIGVTMRRLLDTGPYPEAVFVATGFKPSEGGGMIDGDFTLHGTSRPLRLHITETSPGTYQATGSVVQSSY